MRIPLRLVTLDGNDARLLVVYIVALELVERQSDGSIYFVVHNN